MPEPPQCPYPAAPPPVDVPLVVTPAHPCSYLPGKTAVNRAFYAPRISGSLYHRFMDAGFRRSGRVVYQPACPGCRACLPIRVPVETFAPSKSQRRCFRRNQDLQIAVGPPQVSDEKYDLYLRYMTEWHASDAEQDPESFAAFLYESPVQSLEFTYRDPAGTLLAVGICDLCTESLSSVYFYHHPDHHRRGLGVYGALQEIAFARSLSIPYYYLGYWVSGCRSMEYKADYRPCEILYPDGVWRSAEVVPAGPDMPSAEAGQALPSVPPGR